MVHCVCKCVVGSRNTVARTYLLTRTFHGLSHMLRLRICFSCWPVSHSLNKKHSVPVFSSPHVRWVILWKYARKVLLWVGLKTQLKDYSAQNKPWVDNLHKWLIQDKHLKLALTSNHKHSREECLFSLLLLLMMKPQSMEKQLGAGCARLFLVECKSSCLTGYVRASTSNLLNGKQEIKKSHPGFT